MERLTVKRPRGLVEVVSPNASNVVQFIHASAKDFLLENSKLLKPHLSTPGELLATTNDKLVRACFNLMRVDDFWDYDSVVSLDSTQWSRRYPSSDNDRHIDIAGGLFPICPRPGDPTQPAS